MICRVFAFVLAGCCFVASAADSVTVDSSGVLTVAGATPSTPGSGQVLVGGGQLITGSGITSGGGVTANGNISASGSGTFTGNGNKVFVDHQGSEGELVTGQYSSTNSRGGLYVGSAGEPYVGANITNNGIGGDTYSRGTNPAWRIGNGAGSTSLPIQVDVVSAGTAGSAITWNTAMAVSSAGRVLIGGTTDDGTNKLQIFNGSGIVVEPGTGAGDGGLTAATVTAGGNAGFKWRTGGTDRWGMSLLGTAGAEALRWRNIAAGTTPMELTYGGNLLLGTTTDDGTNKLQVNGTTVINAGTTNQALYVTGSGNGQTYIKVLNSNAGSGTDLRLLLDNGSDMGGFQLLGSGAGDPNAVTLYNQLNYPLYLQTNGAHRMVVTGTGNIGIGTDTPAAKLEVNGMARTKTGDGSSALNIDANGAWAQRSMTFTNSGVATKKNWMVGCNVISDECLEFIPSTAANGSSYLTPTMSLKSDGTALIGGHLLIGTTTDDGLGNKLQVNGTAHIQSSSTSAGLLLERTSSSVGSVYLGAAGDGPTTYDSLMIYNHNAGVSAQFRLAPAVNTTPGILSLIGGSLSLFDIQMPLQATTLSVLEGGTSPSCHTTFVGQHQGSDINYTLPAAPPTNDGHEHLLLGSYNGTTTTMRWSTGDTTVSKLEKLEVEGDVKCAALTVKANSWGDDVLSSDYKLAALPEVSEFIAGNGHLPGVPSADEVTRSGINAAKMAETEIRKIEELTLYAIQQDKQIAGLKAQNEALMRRLEVLEAKVAAR